MCPLRVILLFLSAMLAGYFAIKTVRAQGESSILELSDEEPRKAIEHTGFLTKQQAHPQMKAFMAHQAFICACAAADIGNKVLAGDVDVLEVPVSIPEASLASVMPHLSV